MGARTAYLRNFSHPPPQKKKSNICTFRKVIFLNLHNCYASGYSPLVHISRHHHYHHHCSCRCRCSRCRTWC